MSNSNVEEIGINDLKALLSRTRVVTTDKISVGDRGISWDGYLTVFKNEKGTKKDFFGNIPVQIKTAHNDKSVNRFPILKSDLENYKKENRIMYFYVTLDDNDKSTIFYLPLQLWDIETMIRNYGNQESKVFTFKRFPSDSKKIIDVLYSFVKESDSQKVLIPGIYSYKDLVKEKGNVPVSFELIIPKDFSLLNIPKLIKEQAPYLKYRSEDIKHDFVIDRITGADVLVRLDKSTDVGFDDGIVYKRVSIEGDGNMFRILCSPSFSIVARKKDVTFTYNFSLGTIDDKCQAAFFINELCKKSEFYINKIKITLNKEQMQHLLVKSEPNLSFFVRYDLLIRKKLRVNKEPDFKNFKEKDFVLFNYLCTCILDVNAVKRFTKKSGFTVLKLFGLRLLVCVVSDKSHSFIMDWRDDSYITLTSKESGEPMSPYFYLESQETNLFLEVDNVDINLLEDRLFNSPVSEVKYKSITNILVNLINYYDATKNISSLNVAYAIASRLLAIHSDDISNVLNCSQILIRRNESIDFYQSTIKKALERNHNHKIVCFACFTVLKQINNATMCLNKLDEKQTELVKRWPIFKLYTELRDITNSESQE